MGEHIFKMKSVVVGQPSVVSVDDLVQVLTKKFVKEC
jgi:hypothetical protein